MTLTKTFRSKLQHGREKLRAGKMRTGILLWLLGVPLPIILLIWLFKGCA